MWLHLPTSCLSAPEAAGSTSASDSLFQTLERSATWNQLHILGNGVVPQQAAYAWRLLEEALCE